MKHATRLAKGFGGAAKALVAACAIAFAGAAQAEYIRPGITINGTTPSADGTYSGYTYQSGVFTLTEPVVYNFAGSDTSGKVRIVAATHCDIRLADGFILDLRNFTTTSADDTQKGSPISLSTTAEVRVSALGSAQLIAGKEGAGLRVVDGQTLAVYPNGSKLMLVEGGTGGAGIGGGYREHCGNITIEGGKLRAVGTQEGSGIGDGATLIGAGEAGPEMIWPPKALLVGRKS